ncbi:MULTISPECIES: hypothetical protein [unclassified Wolbachia]|nr:MULTISPECIES: hypothetical protein [unclassified Wolbachia]MBS9528698.1 hypothetical protein [Wolbachia endosymbiont of Ceratitis capitata]
MWKKKLMPKVISGICRRKHFNLEGKVVNSSEYVMDQQKARYEWNSLAKAEEIFI